MRSQLDCVHDSLPGTGVFDLKTRAISPIRHDARNYANYLDVGLATLTGRRCSFEEEYFDMIRAAFLEYSFQARIGNMDGVLVAYHNTARIFGFQYVSLNEMDLCLFGREGAGTQVFQRCIWIMEMLYEEITKCFPNEARLLSPELVESRGSFADSRYVVVSTVSAGHVRETREAPPCVDRARSQPEAQDGAIRRRAPAIPYEHRAGQAGQRPDRGWPRCTLCASTSIHITTSTNTKLCRVDSVPSCALRPAAK